MKRVLSFSVIAVFLVAGCGQKSEPVSTQSGSSAPLASSGRKTVDPATAGVLKGKVFFDGVPPQTQPISVKGNPECALLHANGEIPSESMIVNDGKLQNVFVYVKEGLEDYSFPVPAEPVEINNKACVYVPHVTGAQVDQPVAFVNGDSTLHNVHALPKNSKQFNLGLPFAGMKQVKKFSAAEVMVPLKCDVHPWMLGYVGVLPHPCFGVTGPDGLFEIKNLPPGDYVIEAWHEKLGVQSQKITIGPRETKEIEFRFKA